MAIEVSKEETELYAKKLKRERIIMIATRILLISFVFLSAFYFMFFYKPKQKDIEPITSTQKFLKKEEINELREIINSIEKTDINRLTPVQ